MVQGITRQSTYIKDNSNDYETNFEIQSSNLRQNEHLVLNIYSNWNWPNICHNTVPKLGTLFALNMWRRFRIRIWDQ